MSVAEISFYLVASVCLLVGFIVGLNGPYQPHSLTTHFKSSLLFAVMFGSIAWAVMAVLWMAGPSAPPPVHPVVWPAWVLYPWLVIMIVGSLGLIFILGGFCRFAYQFIASALDNA